ncbi:Collagen alpha-5(VI) chain [Heterocephalus glaber]|uniref:Collagen alpha-5(VI) chain n=1 Tax=Heterocephalus glaber TaxID=10181 RepID=G5AM63_HETGA|nr:Collagen alpha-5(VI) chain [Heterocephalus glaber]
MVARKPLPLDWEWQDRREPKSPFLWAENSGRDDCKRIEQLDTVFVLDHSGSISVEQQESMVNLTVHLVKKADVGRYRVQFGALKYSDNPESLFYLNKYSTSSAIIENLRRHRATGGNTYTAKALKYSNILFREEHGSRIKQNVKQMLIIITDGESHDQSELSDTALQLRDKGITIFAVACDLQEADVVFLCDGSDSVSDAAFVTMMTFLSELIDNFEIQSQIKIGMAQYGSRYQEIIELKNSLTKTQWKSIIETVAKTNGLPQIHLGLKHVGHMFDPSIGGKITLEDFNKLRNMDVKKRMVHEICQSCGKTSKCSLFLPISGNSEKIITLEDFNKLRNMDVKKRMVHEICQSCGKTSCFVDVVIGFDISTPLQGQPLFHGHPHLEVYLPFILRDITSIRGVSCGAGAEAQVSLAFKVSSDREFSAKFQIYQRSVFDSLLPVTVSGPTHLNVQFLESLWDTFEDRSASRGHILLIFSDGLQGESITMLENQSDRLREAGLDALLVVALNTAARDEFSSFEFGKRFDYRTHLTIGMTELGSMLSQYLGSSGHKDSREHRGEDGDPGEPGNGGVDGIDGEEGFHGFPGKKGEKGDPGSQGSPSSRGPPGGDGEKGFPGDPGNPGQNSNINGQKGSKGEQGRQGSTGQKGAWGSPSSRGRRGMEGPRGPQGALGEPGNPGPHGTQGTEELQGPQGFSGLVRPKGSIGRPGHLGRKGKVGDSGIPGELGPKGFKGLTAASSSSILGATMELSALDISLAIFAFNERAFLDQAFGAMEHLFPGTPNLRKHKVIFVVSAGENHETKEFAKKVALRAKCEGYVIFVISLGSDNMEELASYPLDHHLIQLGRVLKPDLNYIVKFLKPFVYSVRSVSSLTRISIPRKICPLLRQFMPLLRFTAEIHKVSADMSSLISQELSPGGDSPFVLEDSGGDSLVYIPSQIVEPHKLVIDYEKDQEFAEAASLPSGHEYYGRKEPGLTYEPGDASLQEYYMDVAFLIDASQRIGHDEFKEVKAFVASVLDYFHVTPDPLNSTLGDRVAVLTYSPPGYLPNTEECPVYLEFDLITYSDINQMKHHLQHSLQQLNGDVFIGHALQWTIDNVFVGTPNLRKNKVIFIIPAGETNPLDKEILRNVSLRAKCQGYSIFVFSVGPLHNDKELEELASHPLDHHLVQLGRTHKADLDYIIKLIPEVYEIETEESELFGHLGSQEQHFFELGDNNNNSGIATDLTQKLYMLFLLGEVIVNDKEEAYSKEIIAPGNDKQQGKKR